MQLTSIGCGVHGEGLAATMPRLDQTGLTLYKLRPPTGLRLRMCLSPSILQAHHEGNEDTTKRIEPKFKSSAIRLNAIFLAGFEADKPRVMLKCRLKHPGHTG